MRSRVTTPSLLVAVLLCSTLLSPVQSADGESPSESADLATLEARLQRDRGHPLLINFWATWCLPCIHEIPELNRLEQELGPLGARFLAISLDPLVYPDPEEARRRVTDLVRKESFALPILLYSGDQDALSQKYELPAGLPHTVLLGAEGQVLDRVEGQLREEEIERLTAKIREVLATASD